MNGMERKIETIINAATAEQPHIHPLNLSPNLNGFYKDQHLFLLCGGPSLSKIDPAVFARPGIVTMGINNSPKVIRPNLWIAGDNPSRFISSIWRDPRIIKFVPSQSMTKQTPDGSRVSDHPGVVSFINQGSFKAESFLSEPVSRWGDGKARMTMVAAIRVACSLGFCRVVLCGCDWVMDERRAYAFVQGRSASVVKMNNKHYAIWSERFVRLRPVLESHGVEVLNATPESKLGAFDGISLGGAVADAVGDFGVDVGEESTVGMYDALRRRRPDGEKSIDELSTERIRHGIVPLRASTLEKVSVWK